MYVNEENCAKEAPLGANYDENEMLYGNATNEGCQSVQLIVGGRGEQENQDGNDRTITTKGVDQHVIQSESVIDGHANDNNVDQKRKKKEKKRTKEERQKRKEKKDARRRSETRTKFQIEALCVEREELQHQNEVLKQILKDIEDGKYTNCSSERGGTSKSVLRDSGNGIDNDTQRNRVYDPDDGASKIEIVVNRVVDEKDAHFTTPILNNSNSVASKVKSKSDAVAYLHLLASELTIDSKWNASNSLRTRNKAVLDLSVSSSSQHPQGAIEH